MSRALLAAIILCAVLLRFPGLDEQSLWRDEAATWLQVNGSLAEVISRTATDNYPPLYNLLAWISVQLFGGAEWVLRLPSALLGVLNVALLYGLASRIGGRGAGLLAAGLLALSGYHVWYSQEARMYALLACAATAHAWAMLHFLDRPRAGRALLLGLSGIPLIYAHPYGALTWVGIGFGALWTIVLRRDWAGLLRLVLAELLVVLSFVPWGLILIGRAQSIAKEGFWIGEPTPAFIVLQWRKVTTSLYVLLLLATPFLIFLRRKHGPGPASGWLPLLLCWTLLPSILGIIASLLIEPVFFDRYLLGSLPGFLILFALAVLTPARTKRGVALAGAFGLAIAVATLFFADTNPRADWRAISAGIRATIEPGDCLAMSSPIDASLLDYYVPGRSDCFLPYLNATSVAAAPPSARIIYIAMKPESEAQAAVAPLAGVRSLLTSAAVPNGALYV
ncbi:glycosyltransferase family 39 protein, partial [Devosia insulae]|uniref:glycosyltransferase family 39 protein n=1 Tax=Devosia insulae TaxID=408174 RepID=UPI00159EFD56